MMVANADHIIQCGAAQSFQLNTSTGFAGISNALQWTFTQNGVYYALGAGALTLAGNNFIAAASLVNIFDKWKLLKVEMEVHLSANSLSTSVSNQAMSHVYIVQDYDDSGPLISLENALAYPTCSTMVLGQTQGPKTFRLTRPTTLEGVVNNAGGLQASRQIVSPWLDCGITNTPHYGFKLWHVNPLQNATNNGWVTFTFRCYFNYKDTR